MINLLYFSKKFPKFRYQLFFVTSSFVCKNQITWDITWKRTTDFNKKDFTFLHWVLFNIKHLLEMNIEYFSVNFFRFTKKFLFLLAL